MKNMDHSLYRPLLAASITASSFLVGCQLSLSHVTLATMLGPPHVGEDTLLKQFRTVFWRGFHLCPSSAVFSALCCFVNAGLMVSRVGRAALTTGRVPRLLLAGSLMIGLIPYTVAFILPVEDPLLERESVLASEQALHSEAQQAEPREETISLLKKWKVRNYVRTVVPALGMAVAWTLY